MTSFATRFTYLASSSGAMFGGQPPGRFSAQDYLAGDVDLDHFLDSYLQQLHQGDNQQQGVATMGAPGVYSIAGAPMGLGNVALGFGGAQPGMQAGFAGFGGIGGGLGGLGGQGGSLTGLAFLQQQQQALQQQQQQFSLGAMGGMGPSAAAMMQAAMPKSQAQAAAPATSKAKAKGKAGGKQAAAAKGESDCSGSDSDENGSGSDDEPRNRKRQATGGTMDDAERRHQALQEKNRRAQRRFRERQKVKLQELHKQIEELTTKVSSLQSENASLFSRTNILEKVLDMRNEQIQVMHETKEATGHLEDDPAALQGVSGHLVQLSPENIKELGSDQIFKIYQMYVKELSVRLMDDGKVPPDMGPEKMQELEVLVQDLSMLIMRLGVIKPLETRKFIVMSRQYLGSTESEVIELWKNVMRMIDLTEQQKREVVEMKRLFLQKIDPIMEERKMLNMQIQSNLPHDTFATRNALTYIKAHEAVIKLRDNLRSEQHIVLEFAITIFRDVFKPTQMAALLVKCYPAVPDALGIASALAVDLGEPDLPHARQLTMQLGGYLEGSSLMANAGGAGGANVMSGSMGMGTSGGSSMDALQAAGMANSSLAAGPMANIAFGGLGSRPSMQGGLQQQGPGGFSLAGLQQAGLGRAGQGMTLGGLSGGSSTGLGPGNGLGL